MFYQMIKKILFKFNPEAVHTFALTALKVCSSLRLTKIFIHPIEDVCEIMGIKFFNRVGLAAGLDKNGDYIDALGDLGFGFLEVGTITRKPQTGNPLPRLFRVPEHKALINRMGFNNKGVDYLVERLKKMKYRGVLGINIGKNRDTPIEQAVNDYVYLFQCVVPYASYITVNVSSPNTEGLRNLQHGELLTNLLGALKQEQKIYLDNQKKYVPLVVKIAPDLTDSELEQTAQILLAEKIDGVIATNTTLSRKGVESSALAKEAGGLSGKPLAERSTNTIKKLKGLLGSQIPIIGCGGIMSGKDARDKLKAGAELIQLYTGLIYEGPGLIQRCSEA